MREFDDEPRCCEDAVTAECDDCKGFNETCEAYRAAMDAADVIEQRFRRDYADEIAEAGASVEGAAEPLWQRARRAEIERINNANEYDIGSIVNYDPDG